ncbi:MAG TPA: hypothetical protein VE218_03800 [Acidobacteriaceae bacterium]|nr:hypothetical protein [Acidobacteriaceae bacterium]
MKPSWSFSTASSAGVLLALVLGTGAAHSYPCIACDVATSYRAALHVYDEARTWGMVARWWIDPEYAPVVHDRSRL